MLVKMALIDMVNKERVMSQFSPSNARSRQQVEGRRDKKQESSSECAQRNKKWRVQVCDEALYKVVRSVWCCARYNKTPDVLVFLRHNGVPLFLLSLRAAP